MDTDGVPDCSFRCQPLAGAWGHFLAAARSHRARKLGRRLATPHGVDVGPVLLAADGVGLAGFPECYLERGRPCGVGGPRRAGAPGFAGGLARDEPPDWLEKLPQDASEPLEIYRVRPQP